MTARVATERLFFDADKTCLVAEGHPEARTLAAAVGDDIPDGFDAPKGKAADKQAAKPADKQVGLTVNKTK